MSPSLLVPIAAASLVGSLHCAGMCGGFVAAYAGADRTGGSRRALSHAAYHAGRLTAYATLGAAAGSLGAALDLAGHAAGVGRIAAVAAGLLMVLWALASLFERFGLGRRKFTPPPRLVALLANFARKPPLARAGLLGLSSALLPCGWLWAFAVAAAGTGDALGGALVMSAFWSGTLPILLGLGAVVQTLGPGLRRHAPLLSAMALLVIGLYAVVGRWNVPALSVDAARGAAADAGSCHR
jgi:uncharacterized protein